MLCFVYHTCDFFVVHLAVHAGCAGFEAEGTLLKVGKLKRGERSASQELCYLKSMARGHIQIRGWMSQQMWNL